MGSSVLLLVLMSSSNSRATTMLTWLAAGLSGRTVKGSMTSPPWMAPSPGQHPALRESSLLCVVLASIALLDRRSSSRPATAANFPNYFLVIFEEQCFLKND